MLRSDVGEYGARTATNARVLLRLLGFNVRQGDLPPGVAVRHLLRLPGLGDSDVSPVVRIIEQDVVTGDLDTVQLQLVHPLVWLRVYFHSPTSVSQTVLGLGALSLAVNQLGLGWEASVIFRQAL